MTYEEEFPWARDCVYEDIGRFNIGFITAFNIKIDQGTSLS